jgi:uncharacterized membrane protein YfcA
VTSGGGLVVLPIFLAVGFPPHLALGTNMLQSSAGTLAAAYTFVRHGQVDLSEAQIGIAWTLVGAVAGVIAVERVDPMVLKNLLPLVLVGIVLSSVCQPRMGAEDVPVRMSRHVFYLFAGLGLGFFDGCIGAGAGTLWAAFVARRGFTLAKATAYSKLMNATSNVAAFTLFLGYGSVWLAAGLVMALAQMVGAVLGARLVMRAGARVVRPIYPSVLVLLLLKLLYERSSQ